MPSDLSTLDLATLSAAESAIVATIRSKCCQWEQDSADATAAGNLSTAVMFKHWSDSADLLSTTISSEFTNLFCQAVSARFGNLSATPHRSAADQVLDAITIEVASAQQEPEPVAA